ncbi:MAG: alpha/beta hydrolase [Desulfobacterales bacterium]|jgi:pimeloyl-ACP methyl ester carboxylesterase|nr:alpha/beta hydrolase [Desulfobacterales bacterium]
MNKTVSPVEESADIGDSVIKYVHYASEGPPLIFLHATGFQPWLWHPIARELAAAYHIICPYFCDHRDADPETGGFDWFLLASDLTRLCRTLGIASPFMVGHSMGGAVMTIAGGHFGLDIRKMVLIEPILLPREFYTITMNVEDHPLAGKSIRRRNSWKSAKEARDYLKSKPLFSAWDDEMLDLYIQHGLTPSESGGLALTCHPRKEAALFMGSMGYDPWPILTNVTCPVLVLEGEKTENKGIIDFKKAAETFPKGIHHIVRDAGHLIPMEKPSETLDIIRSFFMSDQRGFGFLARRHAHP